MTSLAVDACAVEAVAACLDAAADLAEVRGGRRPAVELDPAHALAAVRSEALLRDPDGRGIDGFAPLSKLWQTVHFFATSAPALASAVAISGAIGSGPG